MKDLLGNELHDDDWVVVPAKHYRHLVKAQVLKVANSKAVVSYRNTWNHPGGPGRPETFWATSQQILKIGPAPQHDAARVREREVPCLGPSSIGETDQPLLHNR